MQCIHHLLEAGGTTSVSQLSENTFLPASALAGIFFLEGKVQIWLGFQ